MPFRREANARNRHATALSLVETLFSIVLVSGLLVVAMNTVGLATTGRLNLSDGAIGQLLAADLMAEIMEQSYLDPNEPSILGIEVTELLGTRAAFDDVDDYGGLTDSPPKRKDGTTIGELTGWQRTVDVVLVEPNDLSSTSLIDKGIKRITVDVSRQGRAVARLVAVRTGNSVLQILPAPQLLDE
jgi:hypothetical protein